MWLLVPMYRRAGCWHSILCNPAASLHVSVQGHARALVVWPASGNRSYPNYGSLQQSPTISAETEIGLCTAPRKTRGMETRKALMVQALRTKASPDKPSCVIRAHDTGSCAASFEVSANTYTCIIYFGY